MESEGEMEEWECGGGSKGTTLVIDGPRRLVVVLKGRKGVKTKKNIMFDKRYKASEDASGDCVESRRLERPYAESE